MRRLLRWGPLGLLSVLAVVVLAIGSVKPAQPSATERAQQLEAQVRCPVCAGESVSQSQTPVAQQIRQQIVTEVDAGQSNQAILARLTASFGVGILEKPPARGIDLVVWVLPVVAGAAALAGLVTVLARWRRRAQGGSAGDEDLSAHDAELVARALAERPQ